MSVIRLYLDEDSSSTRFLDALRSRNVDVITAVTAGTVGQNDEQQLLWATNAERVIYTFNGADFCLLHRNFLSAGREHAGIIVGQQQRYSIGEQLRRMLRIINARSAEGMRNGIEFLSNWS